MILSSPHSQEVHLAAPGASGTFEQSADVFSGYVKTRRVCVCERERERARETEHHPVI